MTEKLRESAGIVRVRTDLLWLDASQESGAWFVECAVRTGGGIRGAAWWQGHRPSPEEAAGKVQSSRQPVGQRPVMLDGAAPTAVQWSYGIEDVVLTLLGNFCRRHEERALEVIRRCYPDERDEWTTERMWWMSCFARWQGYRIPQVWTSDAIRRLADWLQEINYHELRGRLLCDFEAVE